MALTVAAVLGLYFLLGGLRSSAVPIYQDRGDALLGPALPNSAAAGGETATSVLSQSMDLLSKGKLEVVEGIETVWQLPPEGTPTKGVLFVAHGCNHGAIDWWPKSDSCPSCIGLPEEMNITLHALKRGYAMVAVSSADREGHRCWQGLWGPREELLNHSDGESDWIRVRTALSSLLPRLGLDALPLIAFGASSGGGFVSAIQPLMPGVFSAVVSQIMGAAPGHFKQYAEDRAAGKVTGAWPPTMFIHMPRDSHIAALVDMNLQEMRELKIPVHEVRILPQPLRPLYLVQRCGPEISEPVSVAIFNAFKQNQYLDAQGHLIHNPRLKPDWRQMLADTRADWVNGVRLEPDASPLSEELNLLYAAHEITSETTTQVLDWVEKTLAELPASERAVGIKAAAVAAGSGGGVAAGAGAA